MPHEKKLKKDIFEGRIDGNAHVILGTFHKQAKAEGWTDAEYQEVYDKATQGTYDELVQALMSHIE